MAYKNGVVYDLTKNVKDLEINTGFIMGLNDILLYWMTNILPDITKIPVILEKFKKIISAKDLSKIDVTLTPEERMLYTIYSLQLLLKSKAKEQNLEIEQEGEVTQEHLTEYLKAFVDKQSGGDSNPEEKLQEIMSLVKNKA